MPILRAYCRYDGEFPCSVNGAVAIDGFNRLGMKIIPFYGFGDIDTEVDCGPEALVHGYIGDVHKALTKIGVPIPPPLDYPEELGDFYGRKIWTGSLGDIRDRNHSGVFVKPQEQKLFTGLVWHGTKSNRLTLAIYDDNTPCFFSEVVPLVSEYRCFVLEGNLLGAYWYKGDWSVAPSRAVVEAAVEAYKSCPVAYTLDVGITKDDKTLVVEVNDSFAMGAYGLPSEPYARMIESRWEQMIGVS